MPDHDGFHALVDKAAVNPAVGRFPFLDGKVVDRGAKVLVAFVAPVAGEMFCRTRHAHLLTNFRIRARKVCHLSGVGTERPRVGDGVSEIIIYVRDRRKGIIRPDRQPFGRAHFAEIPRVFRAACRRDHHLRADFRPLVADAVAACLEVGRDQHGDFALFLQSGYRRDDVFRRHGAAHRAARADFFCDLVYRFGIGAVHDKKEQLPYLFFRGHGGKGFLRPLYVFIR